MVDIQDKIKEQGDLVRKLKAEKAAKEQVGKEEWQLSCVDLAAGLVWVRCLNENSGGTFNTSQSVF